MKKKTKIIIGVIIAIFILGVISGANSNNTSNSTNEQASSETKDENVLMKAKLKEADVMNGFGDTVIGKRAYIEITNDELVSLTEEQFTEFAKAKVENSGYNYVTIIAKDSKKGIFFPGSLTSIVNYGDVNDEGMLDNVIGYITLQDDGTYKYAEKSTESE